MSEDIEGGFDREEMDEHFEAPSINWEWHPGDVGQGFDGVLNITATGNGFIMLEADEMIRTGDGEAYCIYKANFGQTVHAKAYVARAGSPISDITEETITVPMRTRNEEKPEPQPDPQPEPQPKPKPPVIDKRVTSNGNLTITAKGDGIVMLQAGGLSQKKEGNVTVNVNFKAEEGIVIEATAFIVDANGQRLSDESKQSINVPAVQPPKPQEDNIPCDHQEQHDATFNALLNKIKLWYAANGNKPLTTGDLEKRFSKKFKSPNQRLTIDDVDRLKEYLPNHKELAILFAPDVTVQALQSLADKSSGLRIPSSSLILIVGISKVQQARLKAQGIVDVATLLNRGRTPENRKALAAKLDIDVRMVNSWVKQGDLWRVEGMTTDLAYLLVLAGVRNIEDLSHVDINKISPILKGLCSVQTDFSYGAAEETRLENLIIKAGELLKCQVSITSLSEVKNQLDKILNVLTPQALEGDGLNKQDISNQLMRALANKGSKDLGSVITYDEDPPYHLFKDGSAELSASELELLNGRNIKRGLDFLDDIQFTLPLPRSIHGRVVHRSKYSPAVPTALSDVNIEISGIVSPSDDKKESSENPNAMTDGDGRFIVALPEKYSVKEAITITVRDGSYKQKFVRSASEIIASVEAQKTLNMFYALDGVGDEVDYLANQCKLVKAKLDALIAELQKLSAQSPGAEILDAEYKQNRIREIQNSIKELTVLVNGDNENGIDKPGYEKEYERKKAEYETLKKELFDHIASFSDRPRDTKEAFEIFIKSTKDLTAVIKGDGDMDALVVIDEVFKSERTDLEKAMPRVKLMDTDEAAVRLSTDTAPSRIHKYSMLQRLVEPNISNTNSRQSLVNPIDVMYFKKKLSDNPNLYPQASSLGMGYILNMHQAWVPDGFALGELLYSLILAPGEEQRLIVRENKQSFTVVDEAEGTDTVTEDYQMQQNDDTTAAFNYALDQLSRASSEYSYSASTGGGSASGGIGGFFKGISAMLGLSGGYSKSSGKGSSSAQQSNSHSEASAAAQSFQHSIKSASDKIAQAKRISMEMASSEASQSVATKIIANHNHSHAMTIQYWEVMRRYKLETCIDDVNLVLFVPLQLLRFLPEGQNFYLGENDDMNPTNFNKRYDILLRHYDTLLYRMPYQYRSGMRLIKRFAAYPDWEMEKISINQDKQKVTVTVKGNFMECDSFKATLYLANGKGSINGHCSTSCRPIQEIINENRILTTKDLLRRIEDIRSTTINESLEISFTLPGNVAIVDLVSISIQHTFQPIKYKLYLNTTGYNEKDGRYTSKADNDWSDSELVAVNNYYRKMWHLYKDDDSSDVDKRQISHYVEGLPENFAVNVVNNGATLSSREVSNASDVVVDDFTINFNDEQVSNSFISSYDLNRSTRISITHSRPILRYNELMSMEEALHHIVSNPIRYSQVIWATLTDDERVMMLEQYTIDMDFTLLDDNESETRKSEYLIPLLNCVNVKNLMGFYGNCMILPFTFPQRLAKKLGKTAADIQDALYRFHTNNFRVPTTTISLPTQGMIGEAVLGETNVSEEIDITRFWNWKDSPIDTMTLDDKYLTDTDYLKDKKTKDISALNITGAEAPAAVSIPDYIKALVEKQTPQFEDITGLDQLKEVLNKGTDSASSGRDKFIDSSNKMAEQAMNAVIEKAKLDVEKAKIYAKMADDKKAEEEKKKANEGKNDGKNDGKGEKPGGKGKPEETKPDDESHPGNSGEPPDDDGTTRPAGGGPTPNNPVTTPPISNGGQDTPTGSGGEEPPVSDGGVEPPVSDGGVEPPVSDGGEEPPVSDSGEEPPVSGGGEEPPVSDSGEEPPVSDGGVEPPVSDGCVEPPVSDGGVEPPVSDGGVEPPVSDGGVEPPVSDGGVEPPVSDGGVEPPVSDGGVEPPVSDSGEEPPVSDSGEEPPVSDGGEEPPVSDGGEEPPVSDGGFSSGQIPGSSIGPYSPSNGEGGYTPIDGGGQTSNGGSVEEEETPPEIPYQPSQTGNGSQEQQPSGTSNVPDIPLGNTFAETVLNAAKALAINGGNTSLDESVLPYEGSFIGPRGAGYYSGAIKYYGEGDKREIYMLTVNPYLDSQDGKEWERSVKAGFYCCRSLNMLGSSLAQRPHVSDHYLNLMNDYLAKGSEHPGQYLFAWKCNIFVGDAFYLACYNYALKNNLQLTHEGLNKRLIAYGMMRDAGKKSDVFMPRYMNASTWPKVLGRARHTDRITSFSQRARILPGAIALFYVHSENGPWISEHLEVVNDIEFKTDKEFAMNSIGAHWNGAFIKNYVLKKDENGIIADDGRLVVIYNINDAFIKSIIN